MASPSTQPNGHPSPPANNTGHQPPEPSKPNPNPNPEVPLTSLSDDAGSSKRPRDARLLHLVLSAQGINSYQERVPLQLLDFAYRYTSSVLGDAVRLAGEGYTGATSSERRGRGGGGAGDAEGSVGVTALRQAIASRQDFGFQSAGGLGKEFMLELAGERNRVALPKVERGAGASLALPEEKFCLTGVGWGLKDTWEESEDEGEEETEGGARGGEKAQEVDMGGVEEEGREDDGEDEEGAGRMEDVFGEDGGGGDVDMAGN